MAETKVVELNVKTNFDSVNGGIDKLKTGLKGAATESKNLSDTMQGSKQSDFINQLGDGVGKLNPAFGAAVKGANGLILKMWEMVANPVGAIIAGIVVGVKFLYEAFQSSVAGGKELKTIFAGISAVGEQVKDAIFGLGRALIDVTTAAYKFITLDFKGAAEDMKKANKEASNSYNQLGNAVDGTTFKIFKNLEAQQQANDKARKNQAVVQSETNKLLVQSREILTDETASIKDKKKALEEVTKAESASSAEKVRIAKVDLDIIKAKAAALGGEAEKKMKQEIRDATIALNEAETENAMTGIKLNKQRKMLGRQEVADAKEINDAIKASNKARHDEEKKQLEEKTKRLHEDFNLEVANLEKGQEQELEALKIIEEARKANRQALMTEDEIAIEAENKRYENKLFRATKGLTDDAEIKAVTEELEIQHLNKLNDINVAAANKKLVTDKANSKATIEIAKAEKKAKLDALGSYGDALGSIAGMLGESTAAGKAASVASATISTYLSANKAYESQLAIPTPDAPFRAALAAGVAVASGLMNVQKILSVQTPSGGGGGGAAPTAATQPAAPSFNVVGQSGASQIAQGINGREMAPIKTYVLGSDVSTQQSLNRKIVQNASIG